MNNENPFSNTKASYLNDEDVFKQWVDIDQANGNYISKLKSSFPTLLVGGKGCGKTHLMRFYSFPIQSLRYEGDLLKGLREEGFVGIYASVENLSPHRFHGKGQSEHVWRSVFPFYFQIWYGEILTRILIHIKDSVKGLKKVEPAIAKDVFALLESHKGAPFESFDDMISYFSSVRRELGNAVNNCGLTGELDTKLTVSPGVLLRGIPASVRKRCSQLSDIRFHYLLDEFELLLPDQQRYLHTLVREVGEGMSIKIGSRLYGLKTFETFNDGEVNKEGSEYERLILENRTGKRGGGYRRFARELIQKRLEIGQVLSHTARGTTNRKLLDLFEEPANGRFAAERTSFVTNKPSKDRIYFCRLQRQLEEYGVTKDRSDAIISDLSCHDFPLLEKLGILSLYKNWRTAESLFQASDRIRQEREELLASDRAQNSLRTLLGHFKSDMIAQILREHKRKQEYSGLECMIDLSAGLPRSLLMIMKHVFDIAEFRDEVPSASKSLKISRKVQHDAVIKASNWFFEDALIKGKEGIVVQRAMRNLGDFFRAIRFSDKPVDPSLCTFSVDTLSLSQKARDHLQLAQEYSLLLRPSREHREKNSTNLQPKFQVSPMLAPIWDLPVGRRGVIQLSSIECEAIFASEDSEAMRKIIDERVKRMTAPFFGKRNDEDELEPSLFDNG